MNIIAGNMRRSLTGLVCALIVQFAIAHTAFGQSYTFSTPVGSAGNPGSADGAGATARCNTPSGVALDAAGNVYAAEAGSHTLRKITPAGWVSTLAGSPGRAGSADGTGSAARFQAPRGLAADAAGNVYVADTYNHTVRKITPAGAVTTLAGLAGVAGSADGAGSAARFNLPFGVTADAAGNVYVADTYNHTVRKITSAGGVTTLAGAAGAVGFDDGWGGGAHFWFPAGVAVDAAFNVYVADSRNQTIRKISPAGQVTTPAGFTQPLWYWAKHGYAEENVYREACLRSLQARGDNSIFYLLENSPDGSNLWLGGNVVLGMYILGTPSPVDGHRTDDWVKRCNSVGVTRQIPVLFNGPDDFAGHFELHDAYLQWVAQSISWAPSGQFVVCLGYQIDRNQQLSSSWTPAYVDQMAARLKQLLGGRFPIAIHAGYPQCITWGQGANIDLIFVDRENRSAADMATVLNDVRVRTGKAVEARITSNADGVGAWAEFNKPMGVAVDGAGTVFVADSNDSTLRRMSSSGSVTTVAGTPQAPGSADGVGGAARFNGPSGVAVDGAGRLWVADTGNHTLRRGWMSGTVAVLASPAAGGTVGGGGVFPIGQTQQIWAQANPSWLFTGWTGGAMNNPWNITVPATDSTYTANFVQIATINVAVDANAGGTATGGGTFLVGSTNWITATATNGWLFTHWQDGSNTNPRRIVVAAGGANYTASFGPAVTITAQSGVAEHGTVFGGGAYGVGAQAQLWASGNMGWKFANWSDGNTNNPRSIVVAGNSAYIANFASARMAILLQAGVGGIAGLWTLGTNYLPATWSTVSASPGQGWVLRAIDRNRILLQQGDGGATAIWDLDANGTPVRGSSVNSAPPGWIVRDLDGNRVLLQAGDGGAVALWTLDANNVPIEWTALSGAEPGLIARALCASRILVQFGASATMGYWTLDAANTVTTRTLFSSGMPAGWILRSMTDNYILLQEGDGGATAIWDLDANGQPIAWHTIAAPWPGWIVRGLDQSIMVNVTVVASPDCGGMVTGGGLFPSGARVALTATASNGWMFTGWTGGGKNNPWSITVPATDSAYTANFAQTANITVAAGANAGGTVTGGGTFLVGSTNWIVATASNGWLFTSWQDGSTNNPRRIVVVSGGANYIATFAPAATIAVAMNPLHAGEVAGGGIYAVGSEAQLRASARMGWKFMAWNDGNTNNWRTIAVPSGGATYTATFSPRGAAIPGYFDEDNKTDLAVYYPQAGNWYIGRSSDGQMQTVPWGWAAAMPVPGDYDGDGITDLVVYHPQTGNWYIQQSSDGQTLIEQFGWAAAMPVPGDYDGDGIMDLAVYHPQTGNWYIKCSSDGQTRIQQFGWSAAMPVPGDYDGDGKTDLAVYHPQTGNWYILQSSNGQMMNGGAIQFGWSAAMPVPGDYDGDGKTDLAVYHPQTGNWYILQSGNGQLMSGGAIQFGWSAAMPVPGDYDGDGIMDLAVYHPQTGNWYIQQSSDNQTRIQQFGWSAAMPVSVQYQINRWWGFIK